MQNLYKTITSLVDEKEELNRRGGILKYDARRGIPEAKEEFDKMGARYKQVEAEIDRIEKEYAINIEDVSNYLFRYTHTKYRPVIFRETKKEVDGIHYTGEFNACYISQANPYYFRPIKEIAISEDKYDEMLKTLQRTGSICFSRSEDLEFETITPIQYLNRVNFIEIFTRPSDYDGIISKAFIDYIKPMIKQDLIETNIISNDDNFNIGL